MDERCEMPLRVKIDYRTILITAVSGVVAAKECESRSGWMNEGGIAAEAASRAPVHCLWKLHL